MGSPKIYVAGHRGMVGSSIIRILKSSGHTNIVTRNRNELNLIDQNAVNCFFAQEKIDQVYLAAAKVGGIYANNCFPAEFIYQNLMIATNIIHAAFCSGVTKLLFLGSSCIYPAKAAQPIQENALLSGELEPTNEAYAIAKIAGIKLCESYNRQYGNTHKLDYRSIMPCNLYGPGDNYHPLNSHVIPSLLRRFHEAKINKNPIVTIWGTGIPRREFLYVEDMASACVHVMNLPIEKYLSQTHSMLSHINIGSGSDISISHLAKLIANTVGYEGEIRYDSAKPDGTLQKLMDSSLISKLGWRPKTLLPDGLKNTYEDFKKSYDDPN